MEPPQLPNQPTGNQKIWGMLSHLSVFLGVPFILPFVVYFAMRQESEYVAANARAALNFHLSLLIYFACCIPLIFILVGIPIMIVMGFVSLILSIVAAIKASDGGCYQYPLTLPLIK